MPRGPQCRKAASAKLILSKSSSIHATKTAPLRPIFAENQFSPADEAMLMGLVVRKCHFDVTACAEARRLDKLGW